MDEPSNQLRRLIPPLLSTQRASWEQGTAAQALLEAHLSPAVSHSTDLFPYLYSLCHDALLRASTDGRLATRLNSDDHGHSDGGALDPACIGEPIYYVISQLEKLPDHPAEETEQWKKGIEGMVKYLVGKAQRMALSDEEKESGIQLPDEGVLSHLAAPRDPQVWSDGVYMGPPCLAACALAAADPALLASSLDQIILMIYYLRLPSGLLAHNYDCTSRGFATPSSGGMYGAKPWGVGNGWVCGGIIRVFRAIDSGVKAGGWVGDWVKEDEAGKRRVRKVYTLLIEVLDACISRQREDGLFHNVVDDPSTFVEVNLAQMLSATVYRLLSLQRKSGGLRLPTLNWVRTGRYASAAERMCAAARGKVDRFGFVRDVCGSPRFDRNGTATEGQAWGILMEVARADWRGGN